MGNELTLQHDLEKLERRLEEPFSHSADLKRHGWDKHNTSPHLSILSDGITVQKTSVSKHKEVALGKVAYSQGIHAFEFTWSPGANKHVAIGIASENINVHSESGDYLLGSDDQSIAWDLNTHEIVFNDCVIKQLPMAGDIGPTSTLPSKLSMFLDMDQGTLGFKTGEKWEVAMKGLKHASDSFHVAVCLNKSKDQVTMKYIGSSDEERDTKDTDDVALRFHDICGKNILLSTNNTVASRNKPRDTFNHATVFTNRPLNDGEMFTVSIKSSDDTKWSGSMVLGVSTASPLEINFIEWMPSCKEGQTCLYQDKKITEGKKETETETNIDRLKEGGTVGVCRKAGSRVLDFYVNGEHEISYKTSIDPSTPIYGCVDVYGQAEAVTLISKNIKSTHGDPDLKGQIVGGRAPNRRLYMDALDRTVKLMSAQNPDSVARVCKAIENNLIYPFKTSMDNHTKETVAEQMARMRCGSTFHEYLQFLKRSEMDSEKLSVQCYDAILEVCVLFSNISMSVCRDFGTSDFLKLIINDMIAMKKDWTKRMGRASKLIAIIYKCSEAVENKAVFRTLGFVREARSYISDKNPALSLTVLFTSANVFQPDEAKHLDAPLSLCKELVKLLNKTATRPLSVKEQGFTGVQLAKGVLDLIVWPDNIPRFVSEHVIGPLIQMLETHESYPQECALNTIWRLTTEQTYEGIRSNDLMTKLRDLEVSVFQEVKQAAKRLLIKLDQLAKPKARKADATAKVTSGCRYAKLCQEFKASLNIPDAYFSSEFDMCYCETCHGNRGDLSKYTRGVPPKDYGLPIGWFRFSLKAPPRAEAEKAFEKWHRAYHGTKKEFLNDILKVGEIVPAGRKVVGGKEIKELPNHFSDDRKPDGFNTKQVFLSPSIRYSGVDTYAYPSNYESKDRKKYIAKVALQVLICPGNYAVGKETIGAGANEIDPDFNNQELEWMTDRQGSSIIYGMLVKLTHR